MGFIRSLMRRRQFLIAAGMTSMSALAYKRLAGIFKYDIQNGIAMASENSGNAGVKDASNEKYSKIIKTDVVVLGGGAAGMTAAIRAKQQGVENIIILEKRSEVGGNSVFAPIPIKDNKTRIQEEFKKELENTHYRADGRIIGTMIVRSDETSVWLKELAGSVQGGVYDGKLVKILKAECNRLGMQIICNTRGKRLLKDEKNFGIIGVVAEQDGKLIKVDAKITVLATGGFLGDPELMKKYFPYYDEKFSEQVHLAGQTNSGDGIKMAVEAGGADDGTVSFIWSPNKVPFFNGDLKEFPAISVLTDNIKTPEVLWVNIVPSRFTDESQARATNVIYRQPNKEFFIIMDEGIVEYKARKYPNLVSVEQLQKEMIPFIEADQAIYTDSYEAIAAWIKGKPGIMEGAIWEYNDMCEKGLDDSFYKDPAHLIPFKKPPYYVFRGGLSLRHTRGAIKVSPIMSVVMPYDNPIPGLKACGADVGLLHNDLFLSSSESNSIEWTITSALLAGECAAKDAKGSGPSPLYEFPKNTAKEIMSGNYKTANIPKGPGVMRPTPGIKIYH